MSRNTLATDDYNRANGVIPNDDTPWRVNTGSFKVFSNQIASNVTGDAEQEYFGGVTFANNQWCSLLIVNRGTLGAGAGLGLAIRGNGAGTAFYRIIVASDGAIEVAKFNPTFSLLASVAAGSITNGQTLSVEMVGTQLTTFVGAAQVSSVSDGSIASGRPGTAWSGSGGTPDALGDDFAAGDFVAGFPIGWVRA